MSSLHFSLKDVCCFTCWTMAGKKKKKQQEFSFWKSSSCQLAPNQSAAGELPGGVSCWWLQRGGGEGLKRSRCSSEELAASAACTWLVFEMLNLWTAEFPPPRLIIFPAPRGTPRTEVRSAFKSRWTFATSLFIYFFLLQDMVGSLNLPNVCEGEPPGMSCSSRTERGLDSPDSGLPPSPSAWLQPATSDKTGGVSPVSEDEGSGSLVSCLLFTWGWLITHS